MLREAFVVGLALPDFDVVDADVVVPWAEGAGACFAATGAGGFGASAPFGGGGSAGIRVGAGAGVARVAGALDELEEDVAPDGGANGARELPLAGAAEA